MEDEGDIRGDVFSIISSYSTKQLLHPALKSAINTLTATYPRNRTLSWLKDKYDELYLLLDLGVEFISLLSRQGSICEDYYGLVRSPLTRWTLFISLIELNIAPYISRKLIKYQEEGYTGKYWKLIKYGQESKKIMDLINLILLSMYATSSKKALYPNIIMFLARITFERKTTEGNNNLGLAQLTTLTWKELFTLKSRVIKSLSNVTVTPLAILLLLLRFREWWIAERNSIINEERQRRAQSIPPPMPIFKYNEIVPKEGRMCPLCQTELNSPMIAIPSGRVFCKDCLLQNDIYKMESKCPITRMKISKEHERLLISPS